MKIHDILIGQQVGIVRGHPDDDLTLTHGIHAAHQVSAPLHGFSSTRGRRSTLNYRGAGFSVTGGDRRLESDAAADYLGYASNIDYDGSDGDLSAEIDEQVPLVMKWADEHSLSLFMTVGGLIDHEDHQASGLIAKLAAAELGLAVLELQIGDSGDVHAPATRASKQLAFGAAALHASQFQLDVQAHRGWPQMPGGLYVHPATLADLDQYPIRRDAWFAYYPVGSLALACAQHLTSATA